MQEGKLFLKNLFYVGILKKVNDENRRIRIH
jgi:hypothetical protein